MACHEVSEADIFDSVVPFDLPLDERRKAAAAHIRACPVCLGRVRKLQGTIDEIVARADSKIKTVYHAAQDTPDGSSEGQDAYQYPVSVEVVHAGSAADEPNGLQGISRACRRALRRSAAPLARMAAVGVIILALATLLRTTAPTASGTSAGQLRKAVEKAPNVQVVVTHHLAGPIQGSLIARRLGRLVQRTGQTYIVYDVNHRLKRTLEPQTGSGAPTGMSKHECDWARQAMASSLLDILERVSPATRLHRPVDDAGKETEKGLDVYEFQPSPQAGSPLVQSRYWVYIDSTTGLPQKMEYYQRVPSASEWRLITIRVYTYPTDQEAEDNIQALLAAR